jgi:hypothetical protein
MARPLLYLVTRVAEALERRLVVVDDHCHVALRRRDGLFGPEQVDLGPPPLQPGGPLAEGGGRVDVDEAEQPPEGGGCLAVGAPGLEGRVLDHQG